MPSAEVAAAVEELCARWRTGNPEAVIETLADDPNVSVGGPGGLVQGREAVEGFLRTVVPLAAPPQGGQVHFHSIDSFEDGDYGWAWCEGKLSLPGVGELGWNGTAVFRREQQGWQWVMFNAGPPGEMPAPPDSSQATVGAPPAA